MRVKDKVAVVTGAGRGIGAATAIRLAEEGAKVVVNDIDEGNAKKVVDTIAGLGGDAIAVVVDIMKMEKAKELIDTAVETFGRIDILVNNAGASSKEKPFMEMTRDDWDIDINVNLVGQMNMCQAVLPYMAAQKYGRIVNTSGGQGVPTISVYGAAKAGVEAFTHALAMEVAPLGIIVNGIAPGLGDTGLVSRNDPKFMEVNRQRSALKRLCTPQDVAPAVAYLASDVCSYMVGVFLRLSTF